MANKNKSHTQPQAAHGKSHDATHLDAKPLDAAPQGLRGLLKTLGPGLITGASDDDPSGIGTYSQAGAQLGYGISWTAADLPSDGRDPKDLWPHRSRDGSRYRRQCVPQFF